MNDQIVGKLSEIEAALKRLPSPDLVPEDVASLELGLSRIDMLRMILRTARLDLIASDLNSDILSRIESILTTATQMVSDATIARLKNFHAQLDALFNHLAGRLIANVNVGDIDQSQSLFARNELYNNLLNTLLYSAKTTSEQLAALAADIATEKEKLSDHRDEIVRQSQVIADLATQLRSKFENESADRELRFNEAVAKWQASFREMTDKQTAEYVAAAGDMSNQHHELVVQANERIAIQESYFAEKKNNVEEIFSAIGATARAGIYKSTADIEAKKADRLRYFALGLFGFMIVALLFEIFCTKQFGLEHHIERLLTIAAFSAPAAYLMRESAKHRDKERLYRKQHVELATIDAYLTLLPKDESDRVKLELATKFFGVQDPDSLMKDFEFPTSFAQLIEMMGKYFQPKS